MTQRDVFAEVKQTLEVFDNAAKHPDEAPHKELAAMLTSPARSDDPNLKARFLEAYAASAGAQHKNGFPHGPGHSQHKNGFPHSSESSKK